MAAGTRVGIGRGGADKGGLIRNTLSGRRCAGGRRASLTITEVEGRCKEPGPGGDDVLAPPQIGRGHLPNQGDATSEGTSSAVVGLCPSAHAQGVVSSRRTTKHSGTDMVESLSLLSNSHLSMSFSALGPRKTCGPPERS